MSQEIEHMTEQEIRRSEWGLGIGMLLTGAAIALGVMLLLDVLFNS